MLIAITFCKISHPKLFLELIISSGESPVFQIVI